MNDTTPLVKLNNGVRIPQLGLGVWQAREGGEVERAVHKAIEVGYRLFDTAAIYGNERGVGRAIKECGLPRDEVFITSKLWNDSHSYKDALKAFSNTTSRLGVDYLDLYLIHWPVPRQNTFTEAWNALEKLFREGAVRAIGVSNFMPHHLETLLLHATVMPAVDQIELHPKLQQRAAQEFCREHDIAIEAYSPLMQGGTILHDPAIAEIATAHGKTTAQIVIRWHIQHGFIVIPKSTNTQRIAENFAVFDFTLSEKEMRQVDSLELGARVGNDPDQANF